jgi:hypothetical protein
MQDSIWEAGANCIEEDNAKKKRDDKHKRITRKQSGKRLIESTRLEETTGATFEK